MGILFIVLGLFSFIYFLVAACVCIFKKDFKKVKRNLIISFASFFIMLIGIIFAATSSEEITKEESKVTKEVLEQEPKREAEEVKTFNFSWQELESNWPLLINGLDVSNISIVDTVEQTDNTIVTAKITDYLMIIADVDPKTKKVKYLNIIAQPSGSYARNADILLAFGNLIAVSNSSLTADERGIIMMEKLGYSKEFIYKQIEYKGLIYESNPFDDFLSLSVKPI